MALTIPKASFLNLDIATLPKSCQKSYSRIGNCHCGSCRGTAAAPTSSSASPSPSSKMSSKLRSIFTSSKDNSSSSSVNTTSTSTSTSNGAGAIEEDIDPTELHLLKILPAIGKLALERDLGEVLYSIPRGSSEGWERGTKRKAWCSSGEDEEEKEEARISSEEEIDALRGSQQRRKLVPSSRNQKQEERMERMGLLDEGRYGKVAKPWNRLREKVKEGVAQGWRKCRRAVGKEHWY